MNDLQVIRLKPKLIAGILAAIAALLVCLHFLGIYYHANVGDNAISLALAPRFDLDEENTFQTYFSSLLLLISSLITFSVATDTKTRRFKMHWLGLGALFLLMSIDESLSFHEILSFVISKRTGLGSSGWLAFPWILPGTAFAVAFMLSYLKFIIKLPFRFKVLFLSSGGIYLAGALGMEAISGKFSETNIYELMMATEESLEMLGVILYLYAILLYKSLRGTPLLVELDHPNQTPAVAPRSITRPRPARLCWDYSTKRSRHTSEQMI